jgi:DNA-binding MarR family transcriptional regulator
MTDKPAKRPAAKRARKAAVEPLRPPVRPTRARPLARRTPDYDPVDPVFEAHIPGINYGTLDQLIGYAIRRAQIRYYSDFYPSLEKWGISPRRFSTLTIIGYNPGIRLSDLGHILGIAASGAVVLVTSLESLGYVKRTASQVDKRVVTLSITPTGKRVLSEIEAAAMAVDLRSTSTLSPAERETLMTLLRRVHG